jgi:hypothetical protein
MTTDRMSLAQIALALDRYGGTYDVFEVFADDVEELHMLQRGEHLPTELEAKAQGRDLLFQVNHVPYRLALREKSAVARITRGGIAEDGVSDFQVFGRMISSAVGHATLSKGEGWIPGLFLGVLAAPPADPQQQERSVTVRYNPREQQWRAYGGPMSQWLRQQAAAQF